MLSKRVAGIAVMILLGLAVAFALSAAPAQSVGAQSQIKNMKFYMHYAPSADSVGGVSTNFIINTSYAFPAIPHSFYKASGQPKISEDFYIYPAFAGPVQLSGNWQVVVFANSTALHPATWGIEFWEKSSNGTVVWDSGAISPVVQGGPAGNPGYVDSPIYGYTLTASNVSHTFAAGDTLQVEVSVTTGSTVPLTLWYDSATYPSGLVLPSASYAQPVSVNTQDVNGTARTVFYTYWSSSQRQIVIQSQVIDPFGGYDVHNVFIQVVDPVSRVVVDNETMSRISGGVFSYNELYRYSFPYAANATEGTYTFVVYVVDNNGAHQYSVFGYYDPYIQTMTGHFSLGIQVPVTIHLVSASRSPLNGAQIVVYSGGLPLVSGYTGSSGSANLTVFTGNLDVKVFWRGVQVSDQNVTVSNSTTIMVPTNVLDPTFRILTPDGDPVGSALVFVTYPNSTTGRLPFVSNQSGEVGLSQQPAGVFSLLVFYEGAEVANTNATQSISWNNATSPPTPNPTQPVTITATVYKLGITVVDASGSRLTNATVVVKNAIFPSQFVYGYGMTRNGTISFLLPSGTYDVAAEYHSVWWLTQASNQTSTVVPLSGDQTITIRMNNLPPPIWATLGFWLIMTAAIVVLGVGYFFLRSRRKK